MTTASAIASLSSLQLPEKREQPACSTPISRWQWLDRLDSNNRRVLAPHVAIGVKAFADLAKESHLGSSGAWQAVTTFFYSVNILLIPTAVENLVSTVTRLKNKQNWSSILTLRNVRAIFQSSLLFIVPMTFASIGLKDACQMLGHTIKPFERVLNFVVPWVKSASKINIFFQAYDIVNWFRFKTEISELLLVKTYCVVDFNERSNKILSVIESYGIYLRNCRNYSPLILKRIITTHAQLKCCLSEQNASERILYLSDEITKLANWLLQLSSYHMHYQARGLFFNCLNLATIISTSTIGASILLLGASLGHISREFFCSRVAIEIGNSDSLSQV